MPSLTLQAGLLCLLGSVMAVPYGTGSAGVPYGMGNSTVINNPTGTGKRGPSTRTVNLQFSESDAANVHYNGYPSVELEMATSLTCKSAPTVTFTATEKFTVTITPGSIPEATITQSAAAPVYSFPSEDGSKASVTAEPVPASSAAAPYETPNEDDEDNEDNEDTGSSSEGDADSDDGSYPVSEDSISTPEEDGESDADSSPVPDNVPVNNQQEEDKPETKVPEEVKPKPDTPQQEVKPDINTPQGQVKPDEASYPAASENSPSTPVKEEVESDPTSYPASGAGTGKRGLAYNDASLTKCFEGSSEITWAYNWGQRSDGLSSSFEYVPCLWGTDSRFTSGWAEAAESAIAAGSTHLLAFNEPDHGEQANLSPAAAAEGYKTYMQPFAGKARLGSPGVTNGGGNMGLKWLSDFITACDGCQIDFYAVHWYDSASKPDQFKDQVVKAHELTGKPIWVTEFGAYGSEAEVDAFLQEVLPWLDAQPFCERYSYFMVREGLLVSGSDKSSNGNTYAEYKGQGY